MIWKNIKRAPDYNFIGISKLYNINNNTDRQRSVINLENLYFNIIRETSPDLFVDVGTRNVSISLATRYHLPNARIVAIRPDMASFEQFNAYSENKIECVHCELNDTGDDVLFRAIEKNDHVAAIGDGLLSAKRLDALFPPHRFRSCGLWIDAKGRSRQILNGGQWLLTRASTVIVEAEDCPIHQDHLLSGDIIDYLWNSGLAPVARDFQSRYQYNIVFVRKELLNDARICRTLSEYRRTIADGCQTKRKTTRVGHVRDGYRPSTVSRSVSIENTMPY